MTANLPISYERETLLLRLAREIASDLHDIETILENYKIEPKQWSTIKKDPRFLRLLETELTAWNAASNTPERVKLKAAMLMEEWLPEANKLAHDPTNALPARVELMKLLKSLAGLGDHASVAGVGEKFSITINLGQDEKLRFEKEVTPRVIEHEATTQE